ncbi:MAG: YihA family ribosome biogenesis GTP-binding protein [Archangiaceae bacterium]|nr:YihA family ribosome biogenesis GTP-binding protein [Archangiaceae bacterium]
MRSHGEVVDVRRLHRGLGGPGVRLPRRRELPGLPPRRVRRLAHLGALARQRDAVGGPAERRALPVVPLAGRGRAAGGERELRELSRRRPVLLGALRDERPRAGAAGGPGRPLREGVPHLSRRLVALAQAVRLRHQVEGHRPLDGRAQQAQRRTGGKMIRVLDARFFTTATQAHQYPKPAFPEVAFAGRSNVGKSSMINALCGRKKLVRVSNTPGRTRTLNFFDVDLEVEKKKRTLRLCDLPGYGYAKASKTDRDQWRKMISEYLDERSVLKAVVAIVDAEIGAQDSDIQMIEYLSAGNSAAQILVVATKIDRVAKSKWFGRRQKISEALQVPLEAVVAFSSTERHGIDTVWDRLLAAAAAKAP